jgi:hypothetical protein
MTWPRTLRSRLVLFFVGLLVLAEQRCLVLDRRQRPRASRARRSTRACAPARPCSSACCCRTARQIQRAGELLAADFAFREAVATRDMPTIMSVLVNHGRRIETGAMMLVDLDGRVIADTLRPRRAGTAVPLRRPARHAAAALARRRRGRRALRRRAPIPGRGAASARPRPDRVRGDRLPGGRRLRAAASLDDGPRGQHRRDA